MLNYSFKAASFSCYPDSADIMHGRHTHVGKSRRSLNTVCMPSNLPQITSAMHLQAIVETEAVFELDLCFFYKRGKERPQAGPDIL